MLPIVVLTSPLHPFIPFTFKPDALKIMVDWIRWNLDKYWGSICGKKIPFNEITNLYLVRPCKIFWQIFHPVMWLLGYCFISNTGKLDKWRHLLGLQTPCNIRVSFPLTTWWCWVGSSKPSPTFSGVDFTKHSRSHRDTSVPCYWMEPDISSIYRLWEIM